MQTTILLNYNVDVKQVEKEEQTSFLRNLLSQMGVPTDEIWTSEDSSLTIAQEMKLRETILNYDVQVIDDNDGNIKVYAGDQLVGEWYKCVYRIKKDLSQIDPKKIVYLEMKVNCWSLFEESDT